LILLNTPYSFDLSPFLIFVLYVVGLAGTMILLSFILGPSRQNRQSAEPYESGILTTGKARFRFSSHFYLVAMFFVIFDLEAVFIIAWAVAFDGLGWLGYAGVVVFVAILAVVLLYEWKTGALDFGPDNKKILKQYKKLSQKES